MRTFTAIVISIASMCCATRPAAPPSRAAIAKKLASQVASVDCSEPYPEMAAPCLAVADAEARNVWVDYKKGNEEFYCSGTIVSTGRVLTAGHCALESIRVDGKPATIIKRSGAGSKDDLALLKAETAWFPQLAINTHPRLSEIVYSASNHLPRRGIFTISRIVYVDDNEVDTQVLGAPGVSGSGVYDTHGRLVTMSHQMPFDGTPLSIGVHPSRIAAFLEAAK